MTRSLPYFAEIRLILWQLNHRHGQAFYVHTHTHTHTKQCNQLYPQARRISNSKMPLFITQCMVPRRLSARSRWKFAKESLQLRHVCLSVRPSLCIKQSDKRVFIILATGHLKKSVHTSPLCLQPDIITDQTLYTRTHIRSVSILVVIPQIYIEAKIYTRTKVQCLHYVQHIVCPALIVLDIIKQKSVDKQELWYYMSISQIIKSNSSIWNYLSPNLYTFEFLTVHF